MSTFALSTPLSFIYFELSFINSTSLLTSTCVADIFSTAPYFAATNTEVDFSSFSIFPLDESAVANFLWPEGIDGIFCRLTTTTTSFSDSDT